MLKDISEALRAVYTALSLTADMLTVPNMGDIVGIAVCVAVKSRAAANINAVNTRTADGGIEISAYVLSES